MSADTMITTKLPAAVFTILFLLIELESVNSWNLIPLASYYPVEDASPPIIFKDIIPRVKEQYLQEISQKWSYPVVSNLNHYLKHMSIQAHPIIIIDNFHGINLEELIIPSIIRNPVPVVHRLLYWRGVQSTTKLGIDSAHLSNVTFLDGYFTCPLSKYLVGLGEHGNQDPCLEMDLNEFVLTSKVFSYTIYLVIFPPDYIHKIFPVLIYPKTFRSIFRNLGRHVATPSYSSNINGVVLLKRKNKRIFSPCYFEKMDPGTTSVLASEVYSRCLRWFYRVQISRLFHKEETRIYGVY